MQICQRMFLAIFNILLGAKHRIEIRAYCFQITRTSLLIFIYVGVYDVYRRWTIQICVCVRACMLYSHRGAEKHFSKEAYNILTIGRKDSF